MTTMQGVASQTETAVIGGVGEILGPEQVSEFVAAGVAGAGLENQRVCLVVPDGTRTCPLPLLLQAMRETLGSAAEVKVVIALGTHQGMSDEHLGRHLGFHSGALEQTYRGWQVLNHEFWLPETFTTVGTISADRIAQLTGGLLADTAVDVRINRHVAEADVAIVVGPVFPHEVVGFSGGNKYFFPGVSSQEVINLSHWLGALITSAEIIGTRGTTPVRALIDEAVSLVPGDKLAFCVVVQSGSKALHSVAFGTPEDAWAACAAISAETHIRYLDAPVRRVLSIIPTMYHDMWTAAKGFYKVEPIVADGGQVVLYAPHVHEISSTHPEVKEVGYHCRDYFVKQWDRFRVVPWGVLDHSTHLRGAGTYDEATGTEHDRVTVTLATGIPEEQVRAVNLDYLDPAEVDTDAWAADPETLVIPRAGEDLFRLR